MTQPTFTQVRQALATTLASISGLRTYANRIQPNPPAAVIMPVTGTFASYSETFDGAMTYTLRAIVLVAEGDGTSGMDQLDPYIATSGAQSIWAAVQANPTLGGVVSYAVVTEATGYGLMNWMGIDYLAAHFIVQAGI